MNDNKFITILQDFKNNKTSVFDYIASLKNGSISETVISNLIANLLKSKDMLASFLKYLDENLCNEKYKIIPDNLAFKELHINTEKHTEDKRFMDIYIEFDDVRICIENKSNNAIERDNQIYDYLEDLYKASKKNERFFLIFLTQDGYEPISAENSEHKDKIINLALTSTDEKPTFAKWLKESQTAIKDETLKTTVNEYFAFLNKTNKFIQDCKSYINENNYNLFYKEITAEGLEIYFQYCKEDFKKQILNELSDVEFINDSSNHLTINFGIKDTYYVFQYPNNTSECAHGIFNEKEKWAKEYEYKAQCSSREEFYKSIILTNKRDNFVNFVVDEIKKYKNSNT